MVRRVVVQGEPGEAVKGEKGDVGPPGPLVSLCL